MITHPGVSNATGDENYQTSRAQKGKKGNNFFFCHNIVTNLNIKQSLDIVSLGIG